MPDSASSIGGVGSAASATPSTKVPGQLDKDAFLKLLVAQLKYQNPLQPSDPSQFMAQTAQFTMVERLEQISKAQAEAGTWQRIVAGQGLIGRQVTGQAFGESITGTVVSLKLDADGGTLTLSDGRQLAVGAVETVASPQPQYPAAGSSPNGRTAT